MTQPETGWKRVKKADLDYWDKRLAASNCHLFQYPMWCEPYRIMHLQPIYLTYILKNEAIIFTAILTAGMPGFKIGLLFRGPFKLDEETAGIQPEEMMASLVRWCKKNDIIALKFSNDDDELYRTVESQLKIGTIDPFPWYNDLQEELIVEQVNDDEQMKKSFKAICRREIKQGLEENYTISTVVDEVDFRNKIWQLFSDLSKRKGFKYRPLRSYEALLKRGKPINSAKVYMAEIDGVVVNANFYVSDKINCFHMSGALDFDAVMNRRSPAVLLHWRAMRDFHAEGKSIYNLGTKSGRVYQFKQKFNPEIIQRNDPIFIICHPLSYRIWTFILRIITKPVKKLRKLIR